MILQSLTDYYKRLARDPNSDVAEFGFSRQKVAFAVVVDPDGRDHRVKSVETEKNGKRIRQSLIVLGNAKPSGSGINPCFLWDNMAYMLGVKADDEKPERTRKSFEAFRDKHLQLESELDDEHFSHVCNFLRSWNPESADESLTEIGIGFGLFRIRGVEGYVHERPAIRKWWLSQINRDIDDTVMAECLVTGEHAAIARLHEPKIKGVAGAQPAGASIVSFNLDAFESYGKEQSYNAPVSRQAAFEYATALNRLLNSQQRFQIGDATTVFWTAEPSPAEDFFGKVISGRVEDDNVKTELSSILRAVSKGQFPSELGDPATSFYVLGLSPNSSRVSIRFWYQNTLGELVEKLHEHFADLEIIGPANQMLPPTVRDILDETVPLKRGRPDRDKIAPNVAGAVMRSILNGTQYPMALLDRILSRIVTDGFVDPNTRHGWRDARYRRAATLKACVNRILRQRNASEKEKTVDTYLNRIHPSAAYQCGRLMGVLAFIQERALNKVNASIVRRYLSAASAAPAVHLGRLQVQAEVGHLHKLDGDIPEFMRDELKQINSRLGDSIPRTLDSVGRSLFVLGFYQEVSYLERRVPKQLAPNQKWRWRTDRGEWVRSLGERAVANVLNNQGIPYDYEPRTVLDEGPYRIPDFVVYGEREEDTHFIEFLGMKDNAEYDERWHVKRRAYHASGITEDGGPRGKLVVIDAREDENLWKDETRLSRLLADVIPQDVTN